MKMTGTIRLTNPNRHYGWINTRDGQQFKYQAAQQGALKDGDNVSFEIRKTSEHGQLAVEVRRAW